MTQPRHARARAAIGLAAAALAASTPVAALVTYPGAAPCDGTLQACIDGVAAGETIEIATATPIPESLAIGKNLALRSAAGILATLLTEDPGQGTVVLSDAAGPVTVRLEGLRFVRTTIGILGFADGSSFAVAGCTFIDDGGADYAIDARLGATLSLLVERNQLEWTGPMVLLRTSGSDETDVAGVVMRANSMTSNTSGPIFGPSASGVSVEVLGRAALDLRFDSNLLVDLAAEDGDPAGLAIRQTFGDVLPTTPAPPVYAEILNNTFHELVAGPALRLEGPSLTPIPFNPGTLFAVVYNNILTGNSGAPFVVSQPLDNVIFRNDYNDLFANGAPPVLGGESLGPMTFDLDPLYVDEAGGDLRLSGLSPLIDQGLDMVPLDPPVVVGPIDVTGGPRVTGAAVDLGAFETFVGAGSPVEIPALDRFGLLALALLLAAAAAWRLRRGAGRGLRSGTPIVALALAGSLWPAAASAQTGFVHVATSGNTFLHVTQLDHPAVNGNPSARLIVTPRWNPDAAPLGVDNPHPIGVFYSSSNGRWSILNEDLATLPLGAGFNVLVAPTSRSFVHEATAADTEGARTELLDYQLLPLVDTTRFFVTHNRTPDGQASGPLVQHPIRSVFYFTLGEPRWTIEVTLGETMPIGAEFNVYNPATGSDFHTFLHWTDLANIDGEITELNHPALNGNPDALVWAYERVPFGPSAPNNHPIAVAYDVFDQVWVILNTDSAPYDENVRYLVGFLDANVVFADGFELGNTTEWSLRVP